MDNEEIAQRNLEEFQKSFEILVKNREAICDKEGRLLRKNMRYLNKYRLLINKTAVKGMIVGNDMLRNCWYPDTEEGNQCIKDIEKIMGSMRPDFIDITVRGSYGEFMDKLNEFAKRAKEAYWEHVASGMHKDCLGRRLI